MKTIAILLLCLTCTGLCASEPSLEKVDVFQAGMDDVALYRIPGMVVTAKGTVLAYCEARMDSKSDWGEIEIHLRRSTDGGKTWEAPMHIAHFTELSDGRVMLVTRSVSKPNWALASGWVINRMLALSG